MAKPTPHGETPFRINLEQQKKRAKELLKAFHSDASTEKISDANNAALLRFKQHRLLTITDTGKKVLVGTHSWLSLDPPVRWLGGWCKNMRW